MGQRRLAALIIVAVSAFGQTRPETKLVVEIHRVARTEFGYAVMVRLTNASMVPVILERRQGLSPMLQSLDVQQWDDELGWQSVGSCRDIRPTAAISIPAHRQMEDVVPISDLEHVGSSSCTKISRLGGRIRAVVLCAYKSAQEYKNRMSCDKCCTPITSSEFDLPPVAR